MISKQYCARMPIVGRTLKIENALTNKFYCQFAHKNYEAHFPCEMALTHKDIKKDFSKFYAHAEERSRAFALVDIRGLDDDSTACISSKKNGSDNENNDDTSNSKKKKQVLLQARKRAVIQISVLNCFVFESLIDSKE